MEVRQHHGCSTADFLSFLAGEREEPVRSNDEEL